MGNSQTALVVLAAVLVGGTIPVLVQLRATLRATQKMVQTVGARADVALSEAGAAAARIDSLVVRLDGGERVEQLIDGVAAVGYMAKELRRSLKIASALGAAVGPAVAAATHALQAGRGPAAPVPSQRAGGEFSEATAMKEGATP